jgi:broad specificity phosphatase PhoE
MLAAALAAGLSLLSQPAPGPVPAGAVRVYLVRHGQAFSNLDPEPDLPADQLDRLTELGREQSRGIGLALRNRGVALLLSSPAARAQETAAEIRVALDAPPVRVEPRLRPLELGRDRNGTPFDWDQRIAEWEAGRDPVPAGGESMGQMGDRVLELVRSLLPAQPGRSVVLVAHSEVIGAFVGLVEGTPPPKRYPPRIRNGSMTAVELDAGGKPRVLFTNHVPSEASPETR